MGKQMVRVLVLGLAVLAALPAAASAAITSTNVTTPGVNARVLYQSTTGTDPVVKFAGTSTGAMAGDKINLRCFYLDYTGTFQGWTMATNVAVNPSTGAWSVNVAQSAATSRACNIYAIPTTATITTAADLAPFTGHRIYVVMVSKSTVVGGPYNGKVYDYSIYNPQAAVFNDWYSLTSCGLCDSYLVRNSTGGLPRYSNRYIWYYNDSPYPYDMSSMPLSTNGMTVDGNTAFDAEREKQATPGGTQGDHLTGFQGITLTNSFSVSGDAVTREQQTLVRCNADTHTNTPGATCTKWVPTGVALDRTYTFTKGGYRTAIRDKWRSTDGHSHTLVMQMVDALNPAASAGTGPLIAFSWMGPTFAIRPDAASMGVPSSVPWTISGYNNNTVGVGFDNPAETIVGSHKPASVTMRDSGDHRYILERQVVKVPAKGHARFDMGYTQGATLADARKGATYFRDLFTLPVISKVKVTKHGMTATLDISARDAVALKGVKVNGKRARRIRKGHYRITVKLPKSVNRFRIVASDNAGNAVTKRIKVRS